MNETLTSPSVVVPVVANTPTPFPRTARRTAPASICAPNWTRPWCFSPENAP